MHIKARHRVNSTARFSPKRSEAVGGNNNNSYNVFHDYTPLIVVSHCYYQRRFSEDYFWYTSLAYFQNPWFQTGPY